MKIQSLSNADAPGGGVALHDALKRKSALGQFMTPPPLARFMASLFPATKMKTCRLLDAGAGVGALTGAFLDRWASADGFAFHNVEVEAFEIDEALRVQLETILAGYSKKLPVTVRVLPGDFVWETARKNLLGSKLFSHVILNPPYKKINSASPHRLMLRRVGIETVNLYTAFVALSLTLMQPGGQLVAIIPRSFCNGPYYRPFREFLQRYAALHYMHVFGLRNRAFKDDGVLQENIIIRLERAGVQGKVLVSTSTNDSFTDFRSHEHLFERIVFPDDPEQFIHVPTSPGCNEIELLARVRFTLADIGIGVSTGPVVDFRLQEYIQQNPITGTVPLLYPGHFVGHWTQWPKDGIKRGNAIKLNADTKKWLYPSGFYTVVRRFSAKEERRRVLASVVSPASFRDAPMLGFENHLNVFHEDKHGLSETLAHGLAAFLNTTAVDQYFRRFNGHTQVNGTDLRLIKYPNRRVLNQLGTWALAQTAMTQTMLDEQLKKLAE